MIQRAEWHEVMMAIAEAVALRSRDGRQKVGAVVCTGLWRVVGTGYNGTPAGSMEALDMSGNGRHDYVIHAEENALDQAIASLGTNKLSGCMLFCTHRPCAPCLRRLAHLGVKLVCYHKDTLEGEKLAAASRVSHALGIWPFPSVLWEEHTRRV